MKTKILIDVLVGIFSAIIGVTFLTNNNTPKFTISYYEGYNVEGIEQTNSAAIQINCWENVAKNLRVLVVSLNDVSRLIAKMKPPYEKVNILEKKRNSIMISVDRLNIIPTSVGANGTGSGLWIGLEFDNKVNKEQPYVDFILVTSDNGEKYVKLPQNKFDRFSQTFQVLFSALEWYILFFVVGWWLFRIAERLNHTSKISPK
jgi:hypothetical protein